MHAVVNSSFPPERREPAALIPFSFPVPVEKLYIRNLKTTPPHTRNIWALTECLLRVCYKGFSLPEGYRAAGGDHCGPLFSLWSLFSGCLYEFYGCRAEAAFSNTPHPSGLVLRMCIKRMQTGFVISIMFSTALQASQSKHLSVMDKSPFCRSCGRWGAAHSETVFDCWDSVFTFSQKEF